MRAISRGSRQFQRLGTQSPSPVRTTLPTSSPIRSISRSVTPFRLGAFAAASLLLTASYSSHLIHFRDYSHRRLSTFIDIPTMASATPAPQPPLQWDHTPSSVLSLTSDAINNARKFHDSIVALPAAESTFDSVFRALAIQEAELDNLSEPLAFYQNVSPNKELRDASNEAEKLLRDFGIEASMRIDLFEALKRAEKNVKASGVSLSLEEQRLMEKMLLDGKRAGLDLPESDREELMKLKKELSQTCLEFTKNFNEEKGTVSFTLAELDGVPEDVISGYEKISGVSGQPDKYAVTFKTPDIFPIFKYAHNPDTRRTALQSHESRLDMNVPLLAKALDLRRKCAKLLGYDNWADYVEEPKMIKTGTAVNEFLDDIGKKLHPVGVKDRAALLELKKEVHKAKGYDYDGQFYVWDYRYYDRVYIEKHLSLDEAKIKEYFPVDVVVPAILKIYQDLLSVKFVEIKNPSVWHPEVQLFEVWEADPSDAGAFLGYTYLDLFPREAKYSHAAVWPIVSGYTKSDGSRNYPVTAMVANLAKPTPGRAATMRHDDVTTFFHEMGHVFHGLLSQTRFGRFHGTSVARDFVEAPSQMLENWCWEPKVLRNMSSHYETQEPLSDDLIRRLIESRYVNAGLFFLRQLFFGKFDMKVHTEDNEETKDLSTLWCNLRESVSLVKTGDKITPGPGTFGHIAGGYDAGYYGYLYSLVFAADMYKTVFAQDPLSPAAGSRYRNSILKPGGSRDEMDSLKDFLGREPTSKAFLDSLFGTSTSSVPPNL